MSILTHRRSTSEHPSTTGHVVLFAEADSVNDDSAPNANYGEFCWVLESELPEIDDAIVDFTMQFFGVNYDEAGDLINPENIVNSAGAWDDPQFVSELWQEMEYGRVPKKAGFRTYDGCVVIDPESVKMTLKKD
jgi:hypothetical protein